MNKKKTIYFALLLTFILTFIGQQSFAQNRIDISYSQTCAKCSHFILKIDISKNKSNFNIKVKYSAFQQADIDTLFAITKIQFEQIINSLKKISSTDILENLSAGGLDGRVSTLKFGTYGNTISYSIWTPTYNTDKRKLTNFVDACRQIIKLANLNPDKIL